MVRYLPVPLSSVTICNFIVGVTAVTMNVHSLCHLAQQVKDNGPLWSNSMFPFENMVKELGYLYSGTKNTGDQVSI